MDHDVEAGDIVNEDNARLSRSGGGSGAIASSRARPKRRRKGEGGKGGGKGGAKAWEQSKRSWELNLPDEDQDGVLNIAALEAEKRRRLMRDTTPLQRGIIRHVVLVLDMSFAMAEKDLLPTRMRLTLGYAAAFVKEFFEQNPISQLGIVGMRDGVAVRISDLGGNPAEHLEKLKGLESQDPQGSPSLQNALEMCRGALLLVYRLEPMMGLKLIRCDLQPCPFPRHKRSPHHLRCPPLQRSWRHPRNDRQPRHRPHSSLNCWPVCSSRHLRRALRAHERRR